ncbi:MAG: hypothetical protein EBQ66_02860 [Flavobacteriia bacterium]|jgi:hypothetical protein|nr:hypothetical protein [Flavobacteriia bacterium]
MSVIKPRSSKGRRKTSSRALQRTRQESDKEKMSYDSIPRTDDMDIIERIDRGDDIPTLFKEIVMSQHETNMRLNAIEGQLFDRINTIENTLTEEVYPHMTGLLKNVEENAIGLEELQDTRNVLYQRTAKSITTLRQRATDLEKRADDYKHLHVRDNEENKLKIEKLLHMLKSIERDNVRLKSDFEHLTNEMNDIMEEHVTNVVEQRLTPIVKEMYSTFLSRKTSRDGLFNVIKSSKGGTVRRKRRFNGTRRKKNKTNNI